MDFGLNSGDTNATIYVRLRDSATGLAKTGLLFNSAGAVASYTLPGAARAAITLATQTVTGAHSDGGFVEVDATNAKGLYRLDLPDAAIASGAFTIISIEFDDVIEESMMIPLHTKKVNVTQIGGDAQSATDLKDFADAGYDPATNKVQGVVLVDTTTTNTDMRGTDSAALASVCTELRLAELDAANLPATTDAILVDTAEIGAAGAGLSAIPDMATATNQSTIAGYIDTEVGDIITHLTDIKGATWSGVTDSLEAIRDRGDSAWITATGFSTLDAAGVRTAVGLAAANLDTQLGDIPTVAEFEARTLVAGSYFDPATDTVATVTSVGTVTGNVDGSVGSLATQAKADVNAEVDSAWTTQMADSVPADGTIATREQATYMLLQLLTESAIIGTTMTVKKVDGSTTLLTLTLDDGTNPTSLTRAT